MAARFKQCDIWKTLYIFNRCGIFQIKRWRCINSVPRAVNNDTFTEFPEKIKLLSNSFNGVTSCHFKCRPNVQVVELEKAIGSTFLKSSRCPRSNPPLVPFKIEDNSDSSLQDLFMQSKTAGLPYNSSDKYNDIILHKNYDVTFSKFRKLTDVHNDISTDKKSTKDNIFMLINPGKSINVYDNQKACVILKFKKMEILRNKNSNQEDLIPNEDKLKNIYNNLSRHLPKLFTHAQDYSIYHRNVVFCNNITGTTKRGLQHYAMYLSKIKALGHLLYARINMNILKITIHPEDGTVRVRWRISIVTFLKLFSKFWKSAVFNSKNSEENFESYIDGFSIFYVGNDGLIHKHVCDKIMPDESYELSKTKKPGWMALIFSGLTSESSNTMKSSVFSAVNQNNTR